MTTKPERYSIGFGVKSVHVFKWCHDIFTNMGDIEYNHGQYSFKHIRRGLMKLVRSNPIFTRDEKTYIFFNHLKNKPLNLWK